MSQCENWHFWCSESDLPQQLWGSMTVSCGTSFPIHEQLTCDLVLCSCGASVLLE